MGSPEQPGTHPPGGSTVNVATGIRPEYAEPNKPEPGLGAVAHLSDLIRNKLEEQWAHRTGHLNSICRYALLPAGKLVRPVLLLESTAAVGGQLAHSLPAAAGAECGHVASLVHDDIIDSDDLRRGRQSVQRRYGIPDAIVAGDALIFQLFGNLAECARAGVRDAQVVAALAAVAQAGLDLCLGQAMEAQLGRESRFDVDSYLRMARLKTGALFRGACECGAILGGGAPAWVRQLASYGEHLGLAFQIRDDLLPYVSNTETVGKRDTSDVHNGRWTLPVILAYERAGGGDREVVCEALSGMRDPAEALGFLRDVIARTEAEQKTLEMACGYARVAQEALAGLPPTASRDRLAYFADLAIIRNR